MSAYDVNSVISHVRLWCYQQALISSAINTPSPPMSGINEAGNSSSQYAEITMVPVATPGSCSRACSNALPFMVLLFFMTFVVAITQMPLLMIVLR